MKFYALNIIFRVLLYILAYTQSAKCQKVKLAEIDHLTFYKDRFTTGRRLSPVPQLKCDSNLHLISYSNCYKFQPDVVHCYNRGIDATAVKWECKADLDKRVRFSVLKVSCEGYDYKNDPYVLIGSCGLEYSLETRTPKSFSEYYENNLYGPSRLSNLLTILIIIIIMMFIYKSCCKKTQQHEHDTNHPFDRLMSDTDNYNAIFPPPPPPYEFNNAVESKPELLIVPNTNTNDTNLINNTSNIVGNNIARQDPNGERPIDWSDRSTRNESPPPAYEATESSNTVIIDPGELHQNH